MIDVQNKLLSYVTNKLFDSSEICPTLVMEDSKVFFDEALAQQVEGLIYESVQSELENQTLAADYLSYWKKFVLMRTLAHKQTCSSIPDIFTALNASKIPYVNFKGYVFKELYPSPELRYMGDVDIYVDKVNIDATKDVLIGLDYIEDVDPNHPFHFTFKKTGAIDIELHYNFFHEDVFHNDFYLEKHIWENTQWIDIEGVKVCVPSYEHSLVHGVLHIVTHFVGTGFGLRQLIDIALFLDQYGSKISFDVVKKILNDYQSTTTYAYVIEMCNRYFNKSYEIFDVIIEDKVIDALDDLLFDSGVFGHKSYSSELKRIILRKKIDDNIQSKSSFRMKMIILFPSSQRIGQKYRYAKKIKFLLPIAWLHRIISGFIHPNEASKELLTHKIDGDSIEKKIWLMDTLNLKLNE